MSIDIVIKVQVCTIGFARDNALIQIDTETFRLLTTAQSQLASTNMKMVHMVAAVVVEHACMTWLGMGNE